MSESVVVQQLRAAGCVFAEDEARLLIAAAATPAELVALVGRRIAGLPLEHLLGWAEFAGLRIVLEPGVFVPRRRSELLARQAVALARPGAVVVDLCCGSGAIGAVLAAAAPGIELYAADIDPVAVRCARRNLVGQVFVGDLFEPLPDAVRGRVSVLVANVPYVPSESVHLMPVEARQHEPLGALDGGADGLDVLRRVAAEAGKWLVPGGHLLVETSAGQVPAAVESFTRNGLRSRVVADEELGATVILGHSGT
jgi:release factor glutamine methyltransferase